MTEDIMPPQLLEVLQPENVSPLVGYLASEECTESGRIFSVGGGYIARVAIVEGAGATFEDGFTPEDVADKFDQISYLPLAKGNAEFTTGVMEQTGKIVQAMDLELN